MMGGEKPTSDEPETAEDYEATVIDFLDREITASAKSTCDQEGAPEELDALVANLLKDVITTSEQDSSPAAADEDVDALLAGIIGQAGDAQARPDDASFEAVPAQKSTVDSAGCLKTERVLVIEPPGTPVPEPAIPASSESASGTEEKHPYSPDTGIARAEKSPDAATKEPGTTTVADSSPALTFSMSQPAPGQHRLVIAVAFACFLASIGFGVYRLTGSSSKQTTVSVSPQIAPTAPLKAGLTLPRDLKTETQAARGPQTGKMIINHAAEKEQQSSPAAFSQPAAQAQNSRDTGKGVKASPVEPSSSGDIKNTLKAVSSNPVGEARPQEVSTSSGAASAAIPPAAIVEQPAPPAVSAVENPAGTRQPEKVDTVTLAPATSEPKSAQPDPGATNRVDSAPVPVPSVVTPAVLISQVRPIYPELAGRMRIAGTVILDIDIDARGNVIDARRVTGLVMLASAAVDAVKKWRYKPAAINGKSVPGTARISIEFKNP